MECGCFTHEIPIEARRQRVAVAQRVEETIESTLSVVANITSPEASNRFPNSDVQATLHILCQNLIDPGEKSAAELHEELDNAIIMHFAQQDIDPEVYPPSSDGGEDGFHGWDRSPGMCCCHCPKWTSWIQMTRKFMLLLRDVIAPVIALNVERCAMRS